MLKGKTAIVTGSTSGIGLGIARALGGAGVDLMLNGFGDAPQIEALRAGLAKNSASRSPSAARTCRSQADPRDGAHGDPGTGAVDILVNNAGIQHVSPVDEFPDDRWDAVIAINLSSNFHSIKAVLPQMKTPLGPDRQRRLRARTSRLGDKSA